MIIKSETLSNTPTFPEKVYDFLPEFLKSCCSQFNDPRSKDIFLLGALSILGGAMENVKGSYAGKYVRPNIFTFIIAPPANNKSAFGFARKIGADFDLADKHEDKKCESKSMQYKPSLIIPANTSSSAIIDLVNTNNGSGVIFETEADTLSNSLGQDWGDFSDLLRKAYHNEPVTLLRKTNREQITINDPCFSVAVSGTPDQIQRLIPSAQNGLFSRFMFYIYQNPVQWKTVSPDSSLNKDDFFKEKSLAFSTIISQMDKAYVFCLTEDQWRAFNQIGELWLQDCDKKYEGAANSLILRAMVNMFKISMILSTLRMAEGELPNNEKIVCHTNDLYIAYEIILTITFHNLSLFECMPENINSASITKNSFLSSLPNEFNRSTAVDIGDDLNIKTRTVDKYLNSWLSNGTLEKPTHGHYKKVA